MLFFCRVNKSTSLIFKGYSGVGGTQNDRVSPLKSEKFILRKSEKALSRHTLKHRFNLEINLSDVLLQTPLGIF